MNVTDLSPGDCYIPKFKATLEIAIQIGAGGDCGIFLGTPIEGTFDKEPIFRVIVNQKDFIRHWKKVGHFQLGDALSKYGTYAQKDFLTSDYYRVNFKNPDAKMNVSKDEFEKTELLSIWKTENIQNRLNDLFGTNLFA